MPQPVGDSSASSSDSRHSVLGGGKRKRSDEKDKEHRQSKRRMPGAFLGDEASVPEESDAAVAGSDPSVKEQDAQDATATVQEEVSALC